MDSNEHKLLLREEVFQIVGCAMEVLNTLGHGLLEKPYENALVVEFKLSVCREIDLSFLRLTSPALKDRSTLILSLRDVYDPLPRQGLLRVARYFSAGSRA